jgi:hypothetical protein
MMTRIWILLWVALGATALLVLGSVSFGRVGLLGAWAAVNILCLFWVLHRQIGDELYSIAGWYLMIVMPLGMLNLPEALPAWKQAGIVLLNVVWAVYDLRPLKYAPGDYSGEC